MLLITLATYLAHASVPRQAVSVKEGLHATYTWVPVVFGEKLPRMRVVFSLVHSYVPRICARTIGKAIVNVAFWLAIDPHTMWLLAFARLPTIVFRIQATQVPNEKPVSL